MIIYAAAHRKQVSKTKNEKDTGKMWINEEYCNLQENIKKILVAQA